MLKMDKKKIMKVIVLIAVICIPIMYSFFYLKSYWDPYGNLKGMKIAMVNLDEGENGENQGQELVKGLIEKDVVTVCEVSEEEAQEGLVDEKYFAVITIPKNFTNYLNSASTTDKKISTITYSPNQKMNYLASQIVAKVVSAVELELQSQVSEKVVDTLADKLESVPESLGEINNGADQILDGANQLSNGLNEMNNGVATLNHRYTEFDNGVNTAYNGSQTLNNAIAQVNSGAGQLNFGATQLDSAISQINQGASTLSTSANAGINDLVAGIGQLQTGSNDLQAGASQLSSSTTAYVDGVNALNGNVSQVLNGIVAYGNANPAVLADPNIATLYGAASQILGTGAIGALSSNGEALKAGANQVSAGAVQVSGGATQLANGAGSLNTLANGMATLNSSLAQLQAGSQNLKSGVTNLSSGTNQLQTGSASLTQGLATLSASSTQVKNALDTLQTGSQSAYSGSLELVDGVQTFKTEVNKGLEEANAELVKLDGLSEFVKNPVEIEEVDYGEVSTYGVAFTPLFISVALWVGALMAYVVLYYDQEKRYKLLGKFAENKFVQCALYFGLAVVQGFVTAFLLKIGLGMEIQNTTLYYGSAILIAIAFMSIIQFLIMNFGEVGKFVALLLLVLQLASSGGTFPVEIIDESFQKISPYMPMTYTIKLMKESLILEREGAVASNVKILLGISIVCILITGFVEWFKKYYAKKKNKATKEPSEGE